MKYTRIIKKTMQYIQPLWLQLLVQLVMCTTWKYKYLGYTQYPSIIKGITYIDNQQIVLQYNKSTNMHLVDSKLPLMHYPGPYPDFAKVNQLYYRIGYLQKDIGGGGGILYQWESNYICEFMNKQHYSLSSAMTSDETYTYILNQDEQMKLIVIDDKCKEQQHIIEITPISGPKSLHNLQNHLILATQISLFIISKQFYTVIQTIQLKFPLFQKRGLNITGQANNETIVLYGYPPVENGDTSYEVYRRVNGGPFQLLAYDWIPAQGFLDFDQYNQGRVYAMSNQCAIYGFNLDAGVSIQPVEELLGNPIGFDRKLGLYIRPDGTILKLTLQPPKLTKISKIPTASPPTSSKFRSESLLFFTTAQNILYYFNIKNNALTLVKAKIQKLLISQRYSQTYITDKYAVGCQARKCTFYGIDDVHIDAIVCGVVQLGGVGQAKVHSFVQDSDINSDYSWYYLVVRGDSGLEVFGLIRSPNGTWSLTSAQSHKIPQTYSYFSSPVSSRNRTYLLYYTKIQENKTQLSTYSARNSQVTETATYTNILKVISSMQTFIVLVYNNQLVQVAYSSINNRSKQAQFLKGINQADSWFLVDGYVMYYKFNGVGYLVTLNKDKFRIQYISTVLQQFCSSINNPNVFKFRQQQQSVFIKSISSNQLNIVSKSNSTDNFTSRTIKVGFYNYQFKLKSLSYDRLTDVVYLIVQDPSENKQHLLYQSLNNFLSRQLGWRYRYTHNKIHSFTSTFSHISILSATPSLTLTKYKKNLGLVKTPRIFIDYHMSSHSQMAIVNNFSSGTEVVNKCNKVNFITGDLIMSINNPPYSLDYMNDIQISPLGKFVFVKGHFYDSNGDQVGIVEQLNYTYDSRFMDDQIFINIQSGSSMIISLYHFQLHPFNYTKITTFINSTTKILYAFNRTHILYTKQYNAYIMDTSFRQVHNFSINQIGHEPNDVYLTDYGDVFFTLNTLLFKWKLTVADDDHDDDGDGARTGLWIGIGVGVGVVVGVVVGVGIWKVRKIRAKRRQVQNNSLALLTEQGEQA